MSFTKAVPNGAVQHTTAGPYSPVLAIQAEKIIVLSGQASLDLDGTVVGATIEEQTEKVLDNCERLLNNAGCTFENVIKCNVFLKDLALWDRFNEVYKRRIPDPKPARTAVGAQLLPDFLLEIEMWAAL